jgi:uncharacterized membrane protein YfcA
MTGPSASHAASRHAWRTTKKAPSPKRRGRLTHIDYRAGILLGLGGIGGAQISTRLVEHVSTASFRKIFAGLLLGLVIYQLRR